MFSKFGAFSTFGAFSAAGGKHEIRSLVDMITGEPTTPLIQNRQAEIIGRAISLALQVFIVILCGGLLIDPVESGLQSDVHRTRQISKVLYVAFFGLFMLALCRYNGKLWHTTTLTRRCVYLVGSLYSDGMKKHAE